MESSTSTPQQGCAPQPSPSAPEKRRPSVLRPVFCEPVTDTKLFHSASLVQDAMFLAKFFSALKGAARLRLARRDVQKKVETCPEAPLSPGPQLAQAHRPFSPREQSQLRLHRVPRDLRSEVRDWAHLNPDGPSWRSYSQVQTAPPPQMYTIDENTELHLPASSLSFESQSQAPITGPEIKRRGGMSQLTMLEEEEEEEEEEEPEKGYDVSEDETSESFEESTLPHLASFKRPHHPPVATAQPPMSHHLRFSAPRSDFEALLYSRLTQHHSLVQSEKAALVAAPRADLGRVY
ncbi:hypothetical protein PENSPDRAFT_646238 [Peniophora sp. CONT]|nr:hypothetical protein PENSPDRAFT_646238 [Peniophora sp. CONT]